VNGSREGDIVLLSIRQRRILNPDEGAGGPDGDSGNARSARQPAGLLGLNPTLGAIVDGTGGVRKLRWAIPGRGKRSGARVIYYFHNESLPLLALDISAKNEKEDITEGQKKRFRLIAAAFVKANRR